MSSATKSVLAMVVTLAACGGGPSQQRPGPTSLAPQALATLRDLVFADQDLDAVVAIQKDSPVDDPASPWPRLATAARLRRDDPEAATAELEQVLALPGLETRVQLWTWTALRSLGVSPDEASADTVQGVVIENPVDGGVDTLAVFRDGTMRYFDHGGKAVFRDAHEGTSTPGMAELIRKPIALGDAMPPSERGRVSRGRPPSRPGWVRLSFLGFGGVRYREAPLDAVNDSPLAPFVKASADIIGKALGNAGERARAR